MLCQLVVLKLLLEYPLDVLEKADPQQVASHRLQNMKSNLMTLQCT